MINQYNLPINTTYRIVETHGGSSVLNGGGSTCDNCNRVIVPFAVIEQAGGKYYRVGLDCAETLCHEAGAKWALRACKSKHNTELKSRRELKARLEAERKQNEIIAKLIESDSLFAYRLHESDYTEVRVYDTARSYQNHQDWYRDYTLPVASLRYDKLITKYSELIDKVSIVNY